MDVEALVTIVKTSVLVSDTVSKETLTVSCNDSIMLITHAPTWKTQCA
jgi:thiamine pyrophosphokinase